MPEKFESSGVELTYTGRFPGDVVVQCPGGKEVRLSITDGRVRIHGLTDQETNVAVALEALIKKLQAPLGPKVFTHPRRG